MNLKDAVGENPLLVGIRKNRIWAQETSWVGEEWVGGNKIVKPLLPGRDGKDMWQNYSVIATWVADSLSTLFPVSSWVVSSFWRLAVIPPENIPLVNMRNRFASSNGQLEILNSHSDAEIKFRLTKRLGSELWISTLPFGRMFRFREPACAPTCALPNTEDKVAVLEQRFKDRTCLWSQEDAKRQ